jgi:hypothetical protein
VNAIVDGTKPMLLVYRCGYWSIGLASNLNLRNIYRGQDPGDETGEIMAN